jgi:hypothetical protein
MQAKYILYIHENVTMKPIKMYSKHGCAKDVYADPEKCFINQ